MKVRRSKTISMRKYEVSWRGRVEMLGGKYLEQENLINLAQRYNVTENVESKSRVQERLEWIEEIAWGTVLQNYFSKDQWKSVQHSSLISDIVKPRDSSINIEAKGRHRKVTELRILRFAPGISRASKIGNELIRGSAKV